MSQYAPVNARSVACCRSTAYCSGLRRSRHSASVSSTRRATYITTSETATNCVTAAATTSRWKISWKPSVRGNGFGHFVA